MFVWLDRFFDRKPIWQTGFWCILLVVFFGLVDDVTGYELSFGIFYLVPITIAAWYGSRTLTYAISVLAAFVWLAVAYTFEQSHSQQWILLWNAGVRLMFFVIVAMLVRELKSHVQLQQSLARTDMLTGLLNRAGFVERSEALVNSAARYGLSVAIGFIDLDEFKKINDTLGHFHGDEVLKAVGATLNDSSRESDIAGRLGGDEFAVLLPNTNLTGASVFFEKLHFQLLNDLRQNGWPSAGVSIGAIVFERGPPNLGDALKFADQLMYRAKKSAATSVIVERHPELYPAPVQVASSNN